MRDSTHFMRTKQRKMVKYSLSISRKILQSIKRAQKLKFPFDDQCSQSIALFGVTFPSKWRVFVCKDLLTFKYNNTYIYGWDQLTIHNWPLSLLLVFNVLSNIIGSPTIYTYIKYIHLNWLTNFGFVVEHTTILNIDNIIALITSKAHIVE